MCAIHQPDVQRRQLDCLMALLQTDGAQLIPDMWQHVIFIVAAVVDEENWCVQITVLLFICLESLDCFTVILK